MKTVIYHIPETRRPTPEQKRKMSHCEQFNKVTVSFLNYLRTNNHWTEFPIVWLVQLLHVASNEVLTSGDRPPSRLGKKISLRPSLHQLWQLFLILFFIPDTPCLYLVHPTRATGISLMHGGQDAIRRKEKKGSLFQRKATLSPSDWFCMKTDSGVTLGCCFTSLGMQSQQAVSKPMAVIGWAGMGNSSSLFSLPWTACVKSIFWNRKLTRQRVPSSDPAAIHSPVHATFLRKSKTCMEYLLSPSPSQRKKKEKKKRSPGKQNVSYFCRVQLWNESFIATFTSSHRKSYDRLYFKFIPSDPTQGINNGDIFAYGCLEETLFLNLRCLELFFLWANSTALLLKKEEKPDVSAKKLRWPLVDSCHLKLTSTRTTGCKISKGS